MLDYLLPPEALDVVAEVRDFVKNGVRKELLLAMDRDEVHYPREFLTAAAGRNLLGLRFPAEWGGRGLNWTVEVAALEEVGVLGASLACLYSLPSIVGEALNLFGTDAQKETYLLPTLHGELTTAEALTEPRSGSDFFGTTTRAVQKGDRFILNGQKRFIVGAEGADYFLVYARTDPDAPPHESLSLFLVDRGPGVKVEYVYGLMGTRGGGVGRVVFKDVEVPAENLVGPLHGAGRIFFQMMVPERLTTAAGALGMAKAVLEIATRFSARRKAFGRPIKDFEGVSFKIAESITQLDAARALVYATAKAIDEGVEPRRVRRFVSEAKRFSTEMAWQVANHAMQVLGGIGYTNVYPVERLLRDSRLMMIWTGTNEIMNLIIQHEFYKEHESGGVIGRDVEADAPEAHQVDEKVFE